jgi:hypothetical protein
MKSRSPSDPANRRPRIGPAVRALLGMRVTPNGMACIAISAFITLLLAPRLGAAMPSKDTFLAFMAAMFLAVCGIVAMVTRGVGSWRRARRAVKADPRATGAGAG